MATFDVGIVITALDNSRGAFRNLNRNLDETKRKANATASSLRAINVVLTGIAVGAGVAAAKSILDIASKFELLETRLAAVDGGTARARAQINRLVEEYAGAPFAIDAVADSYTRLRAAGLSVEDANNTLDAGVDAVAAFGGSTQELSRFIIGLQQSIGKGTLSMEELRQQIGEAVPSAMRILARERGQSVAQLFKDIESGSVESLQAIKDLTRGLQEDFGGTLERVSKTLPGAITSFQTNIEKAIADQFSIETTAGAQTIEFIHDLQESVDAFIKSISQREVDVFFNALRNGTAIIGDLVSVLRDIGGVVLSVFGDITAAINAIPGGGAAAVGGAIGFFLFGPAGAAIGGILGIISDLDGEVTGFLNRTETLVLSFAAAAAGSGLIGIALFGASGVNPLLAALAAVAVSIGNVINVNARGARLVENMGDRIAKEVGERGPDAARAFLDEFEAQIRGRNIFQRGAATILGREENFEAALVKIQELRSELDAGSGEFSQNIVSAAEQASKALEPVIVLFGTAAADAERKLSTLVSRAEIGAFDVEGNKAERLRRQLEPLVEIYESANAKVSEFAKTHADLTEQQEIEYYAAVSGLNSMKEAIDRIRTAIDQGMGAAQAELVQKLANKFESARISAEKLIAQVGQDELQSQIAQVTARFDGVLLQLNKVKQAQEDANVSTAKTEELIRRVVDARSAETAEVEKTFAAQSRIFSLQQEQTRIQIEQSRLQIEQGGRGFLEGLFGSDVSLQVERDRLSLRSEILATTTRIAETEAQLRLETDPERQASMQSTIESLRGLATVQQEAMASLSEQAVLADQLWSNVGKTISSSIGDAVKGLIKGTLDAEKVLLSFYDKVTDAAIDYLFELIKIEIRQKLIGAISGGGGGFFGFLGGLFADGGAFKGEITPFANGGIVRGPTMFGLAGEAGDEAIMPLERIGGKLGVRAVGAGGGGVTNITIQAIDTQTGAQFLQKHARSIVENMRYQDRLNSGIGSVR